MINKENIRLIFRYVVSGGMGFVSNMTTFVICLNVLNINYIVASIIAFFAGLIVSFYMHKFFTFQNLERGNTMGRQFVMHIILMGFNLLMNVLVMILFVEWLMISKITSAIFVNIIIAVWSFFLYRTSVFIEKKYHG
jgi:putative flippase GtrA